MSYTYVTLEVSPAAFQEIWDKLKAAGYSHSLEADDDGSPKLIDMNGLALTKES